MTKPIVLLLDDINSERMDQLNGQFPDYQFIDAREEKVRDAQLAGATIIYGFLPIKKLEEATSLRWLQLLSAGVPRSLRPNAKQREITVTNLAGLYGPSIAEHTLTLMSMLCRNLQIAMRQQIEHRWDNAINKTMTDLAGRTMAIIGVGNIGQNIARLAQAYGMRVLGSRRNVQPTPFVDRVYPMSELRDMLKPADFVVVAAPLTEETKNILKDEEFAAMKKGAFFVNVSRGAIADEEALLNALQSGHLAGAALDVFAKEPLREDHPFWDMPQVIVNPHYCGDPVNNSDLPFRRFVRNLQHWVNEEPLEYVVDLDLGY